MSLETQYGVNVRVEGLEEIKRMLADLPRNIQKKALGDALKDAANVILPVARENAPMGKKEYQYKRNGYIQRVKSRVKPGTLKRNIGIYRAKNLRNQAGMTIAVGTRPKGFYGKFIEFGWTPTGPSKKGYFGQKESWTMRRNRGRETGKRVEGRPFMKPALETSFNAAIEAFRKRLALGLETIRGT